MIPSREQYSTDINLQARQRLWKCQEPPFDLFGWVLDLTGAGPGCAVLDVGCGNGSYLRLLGSRGVSVVGCDLSIGMLEAANWPILVNSDAQSLPFRTGAFDVVLAAHMLYHVPDQHAAVAEMKRVLKPYGLCVVVTNGQDHISSLRQLVESVVQPANPDWKMYDWATRAFSLEGGRDVLLTAFDTVEVVRPPVQTTVVITDADVVADYVGSAADAYEDQVALDWRKVVEGTRRAAQEVIDRDGKVTTSGVTGAFICR